jgi:hypothetical protein
MAEPLLFCSRTVIGEHLTHYRSLLTVYREVLTHYREVLTHYRFLLHNYQALLGVFRAVGHPEGVDAAGQGREV